MERITVGFLQRILSEGDKGSDVRIISYNVSDAVPSGENFMSLTYRVQIDLESADNGRTKKHLIVKLQPNNALRRERFGTGRAFCNEVLVYKRILPTFVSFAKGKGVDCSLSSFPKCVEGMADGSVNDFLVLEDLKPLGFQMAEKRKGLGFRECELVMRALGEFHAFSLAMKQEDPEGFLDLRKNLNEVLWTPERETVMTEAIEGNVDLAVRAFNKLVSDPARADRITKLKDGVFQKLVDLLTPKEPLAVITHGDFWANNLLLLSNADGEVTEVKLLDLQISRYTSPAIDLQHFLYTSTTKSLRDKHQKQLLGIYHESLTETLSDLGSNQDISLGTIEREFDAYRLFGAIMALLVLPFVLADGSALPNLEDLTQEDVDDKTKREKWREAITTDYEDRVVEVVSECLTAGIV